MPIMCIYRVHNVTAADYDNVRRAVRWEETPPAGAIAHFISFATGGAVEFDVWEDRNAFQIFWQSRMEPVLDRLGLDLGEPEILDLDGVAIAEAVEAYQVPRTAGGPALARIIETDALA